MTDRALGEAVGQDWVKQNFPPAAKASMDQLVAALEKSLGDDIKTLPWMSDDTKKAAEEKLALYPQQDRLSREVARLLGAERQARRPDRQHAPRCRLPAQLQPQQAGQARRREGVGHDAADGQRLLQPVDERHQLPRRHSAAAVLRLRTSIRPSTSAASAWSSATR